ncbi:MAG: hypothetical protein H0Z38_04210 [Firmicutes bacterium]|nr:hypothetical protein [Bacillota bacterium]
MPRSRLRFLVTAAILGIPLLVNYLSTIAPGGFSDINAPLRGPGVIMGERRDVDGDGVEETIRLLKEPGQDFQLQNLRLEVVDGESTIRIPIESEGFVTATLNIIQMDKPPEEEMFVTLVGANGQHELHGFRAKDGRYKVIFGPKYYLKPGEFRLEYLGDKKVQFRDLCTGLSVTLDLSENPSYADFTEAELERFYNSHRAWEVTEYSGFSWADLTGDGEKEIIGSRSVTGVTSTDLIGTLQEYYRQEDEVYKPYAQAFFSPGGVEEAGVIIPKEQKVRE